MWWMKLTTEQACRILKHCIKNSTSARAKKEKKKYAKQSSKKKKKKFLLSALNRLGHPSGKHYKRLEELREKRKLWKEEMEV